MLPHPPDSVGTRDWASAAAVAALLLALAQMGVAATGGVLPPPPVTLLLVAAGVFVTVVCGCAVGMGFQLAERKVSRAALVGATLGPLAWVAMGPIWMTGGPLAGGAMGAIAAAWGIAGVWVAEGLTASGRAPSSVWFWGGACLLFAGFSRLAAPGAGLGVVVAVLLGLAVLGFCFVVAPATVHSDRQLLGWLAVLVPLGALLPWMLPWALWDRGLPDLADWPPSFVFVLLDPGAEESDATRIPTLELMRSDAVQYRVLRTEPLSAAMLGLPDGGLVASRLDARGYATAAILRQPGSLTAGARDVDDRPAGRGQLETTAGWMAGAAWLRGPFSFLLRWVGHDLVTRSPTQQAEAAGRWLLHWRTLRAPAPFWMVLDLRAPDADGEALDAALQELLDHLHHLGVEGMAMIVIAVEGAPGSGEGQLLLVPPGLWPPAQQHAPSHAIWGRELGAALLDLADASYGRPAILPGPTELQTVRR